MTTTATPPGPTRTSPRTVLVVGGLVVVLAFVSGVLLTLALQDDDTVAPAGSAQRSGGAGTSSSPEATGGATAGTRDLAPFSAVELAGSAAVVVRVGEPQSVVVHAADDVVGEVTTTVRSGRLVIGEDSDYSTDEPVRVEVGVPSLTSIRLSGSGTVRVEGVDGSRFTAELPGSGTLAARGSADRLTATLSGSGDMRLQDLVAEDVRAEISGSGRMRVHATGSLDATVSGAGAIQYGGDPSRVTQEVTGAGSVTPSGS